MKRLFYTGFALSCVLWMATFPQVAAQSTDTLRPRTEFITNRLENLTRTSDRQQDYSDLTGDYLYYARHPININSPERKKLLSMHLLNEMQLVSLEDYIHQYGPIYSLYELQYITGFDVQTIRRILPFIRAATPEMTKKPDWKHLFKYGNQRILLRYGQILEKENGYKIPADAAFVKPGSVFLGPPQKLYARYAFRFDDHLRMGFTAEKDAGEVLPFQHFNDSIRTILGSHKPRFPDFFSAFISFSGTGIIQKVIVGDYHLEFGQGLCLWSGLTFGKSAETTDVRYFGTGIRPNTSTNENRFFRGSAITLGRKKFSLTLFVSHHQVDGTLFSTAGNRPAVATLQETGNHRTINELLNKHRVTIEAYGGHLEYTATRWKTGITWYRTRLSLPLLPDSVPYRYYAFRGKQITNAAVNGAFRWNRLFFFGELATNSAEAWAGTAGLNAYLSDRLSLTLLYRNFSPRYHVIYASPFMESGSPQNEQGLYFGIRMLLTSYLTFSAYADYFRFPWLKYQVNAPSTGKAFLAQIDISPRQALSMYLRIRYTQREENLLLPERYTRPIVSKQLADFRYALTVQPNERLTLKTRLEYVRYLKATDKEQGYLLYQDMQYKLPRFPLSLSFRYALFDTDGWNSRMYAYENDVLFAFTIPAYYDKGQRVYLLLHYTMKKNLDFWLKTARTLYFNKKTISSGPETINANHKTEIKFQLQFKF